MLHAGGDDTPQAARYDGLAAWYDQRLGAFSGEAGEVIERRLIGLDISADQLRMAAQRAPAGSS